MAYTSLYRRYRPETFDDVIGQDHIVRTLKNQISANAVGHAYLFTGTRGTGKTSIAKIFARAVNCLSPVDYSPCGKCDVCRQLSISGNFDVLEIDAASNNSVDQIRELTDKIGFPPTIGRYKVYIIDEVHMLSKSAYNALLKTLEEPPSHAIFILATTEVHQIPATILSRCLRFDFRLVPPNMIADRIKFIFDENEIKYEQSAVDAIASAGQGSVRDALSIADMCVSYSGKNVTYKCVLDVLGASDPTALAKLADLVASGDADNALRAVASMCDLGKSMPILASDLAGFFRDVLYVKICSSAKQLLSLPDNTYSLMKGIADKYSVARCMQIMKTMNSLDGEFRYSTQPRIIFEGAIVSCCLASEPVDSQKTKELEGRIAQLEKQINKLQSGFKSAPVKALDAEQVLQALASDCRTKGNKALALALSEGVVGINGDDYVITFPSAISYDVVQSNKSVLDGKLKDYLPLNLVIKLELKLEEDKSLPYLKEMFGSKLNVK